VAQNIDVGLTDKPRVDLRSTFRAHASGDTQFLQEFQRFLPPEKRHDRCRICRRVPHGVLQIAKTNSARLPVSNSRAPPVRHKIDRAAHVALLHHKRNAIKDASVRFSLFRKSSKSVPIALQFKTMHLPVNNGEIDPR